MLRYLSSWLQRPPSRTHRRRATRLRRRPSVEQLEDYVLLSSLLVTTTEDNGDNNNPITGSLRAAILDANAGLGSEIDFQIGTGQQTIRPSSALPAITAPVLINGTSQPGFDASNPVPLIQIDGSQASGAPGGVDGLLLYTGSDGSAVRGLIVGGFSGSGIMVESSHVIIAGNYIGTDASGTAKLGNGDDLYFGLVINGANNTVGGTTAADRNVISGNGGGVAVIAPGNLIEGNYIGTDATGTAKLGNTGEGVAIRGSANNTVGGTNAAARNVISGNGFGVAISDQNGLHATGNLVEGNYIGTDATGTAALGNSEGVLIYNGTTNNTIGGTAAAARNVISGNNNDGVNVNGTGTTGNLVEGNYIGTDTSGTAKLGNYFGVAISLGATNNTVGGTAAGARNVISGNNGNGVDVDGTGTTGNLVEGNYIGTDASGTAKLGNYNLGVNIYNGATNNTVGGTAAGARNVISGNNVDGVDVIGTGTTGNLIEGNYIGTDASGTAKLGNNGGVGIGGGATNNTVGGTAAGARNVLSGNGGGGGVDVFGPGTTGNLVEGNYIGTDASGTAALGNNYYGVIITGGATNNTIGGTAAGARNVISSNNQVGVDVVGPGTTGNLVEGNYIGTDASGTAALGNGVQGGVLISGATNNTVGGTAAGARNVISSNNGDGVGVVGPGTTGNLVEGNYIGTDASGTAKLGNGEGVGIGGGATKNTVGGTAAGARNVISGNNGAGVDLSGPGTTGNLVEGNYIGTDASGTAKLGNNYYGVIIISGATNNTIGGTADGAGNVIWFNGSDGVIVGLSYDTAASTGNSILRNSIYANTNLGIELAGPGANNLQNYPVLAIFSSDATGTTVLGTLNSTPSTTFRIEFFSNPPPASGQHAQGQTYLDHVEVTTDSFGFASVEWSTTTQVAPGQVITATATNLTTGDTSEFSPASSGGVVVATGLAVAGASGTYGGTTTLTATLTAGGVGVANHTVTFTLNGTNVGSATTDGNGVATLSNVSLTGINAGTYPIGASFNGTGTNYASSSGTSTLTVNAAPLTVTAANKSMTYGGTVPALTYTYAGLVNGDPSAAFSGGLATTATSSSGVGGYAITQGNLTATGNYTIGTFNPGTLTISPATPSISWSNPAPITYLTPLSGTQLDAAASWTVGGSAVTVGGTFAYTPPAGSLLGAGTQTLSATFTPSDSTDYTTATKTVPIVVLGPGVTVIGTQLYCVGGNSTHNDQIQVNPVGSSSTGSTGVKVQTSLNGVNTQTTYSQSFTTIYAFLQNGNENVQLAKALTINAVVTAGNGNDNVTLGNGNNTVTLGNGSDNIQAGNGSNTVTAGAMGSTGNIQVQLGNGANNLVTLLGNGNDQVVVGSGNNDSVSITGNGNDQVVVGSGNNDSVSITGNGNDQVVVGSGNNDFVSIVGNGNENVQTGNGTGKVHVAGTGQKTLNLGSGWTQI